MDISKDKKWSKLRGRLHMLGYNHNLGEESVPLVEQLFSDLVHTTESLHESQRSTDKSEKESQNSDVRLVRENQELHLELMTVKGEKANVTRELKVYITKLDNDLALLKSLNKQYLQEMHSLEKDCKEKARLIRQLRRKNLNSWVQAVDANKSPPDDPEAADLQQAELTRIKTELENSQGHIQHLNNQVSRSETLAVFLSRDSVSNFLCVLARVAHTQIDELQETNVTLEQKLKGVQHKSSGKVAELTSKNHELCQEITDIRNLAKLVELEKKQKLQKAEMKLQDLQDIIRKLQGVIKDLEDQLSKKRMEASDQEFVKSQLGDQLRDLREQNEKFEAMVAFLAAEKSRLQDKVQKMMSVEKVVVLELEGWRTKYGICGRERSPSRLDAFVKSLEEERDHFRQEAEHYQNLGISSNTSRSSDRQRSHAAEVRDKFSCSRVLFVRTRCPTSRQFMKIRQRLDYQSSNPPAEIRNLRQKLRLVEEQLQQVTKEKVSLMEELKVSTGKDISLVLFVCRGMKLEQENLELRSQVFELRNRERDLERQMNVRSAALVQNPEEVVWQRKAASGLRFGFQQMDVELKSQEREQATHRMLETHQEALLRLTRDNELIIGDYRRLQDDVAAMTQEKQAAHEKMEEALREREALKQRVHSYVDTVSRIENILKTKNQENLDLVERFRTARSDVQEREQRLQQVEEFIGSVRLELISSETERQHLREALGRKVQEIQQHMQDLHTYKTQVASLTHGMSQLEEEIRVLQEEKASLLADLASVREVCVKMDSDKEIAARQLLQANMELERVRLEDALTEAARLKEHLMSEKLAVRNMQAMLAANRQEMFQAHREASEKEAELKALRHMLTLADNKIVVNAREVTNLRGKVTQLQTKMEVLSSKVLECNTSEDISFRPLRASSPVDHRATPRQPAPDSSIQGEEVSSGLT
uniref:Centrosomal protein 135 n=1 Tax=Hippocampus comes TaxID=109280 RepID=A0A3Q2Y5S6_HIPCM